MLNMVKEEVVLVVVVVMVEEVLLMVVKEAAAVVMVKKVVMVVMVEEQEVCVQFASARLELVTRAGLCSAGVSGASRVESGAASRQNKALLLLPLSLVFPPFAFFSSSSPSPSPLLSPPRFLPSSFS